TLERFAGVAFRSAADAAAGHAARAAMTATETRARRRQRATIGHESDVRSVVWDIRSPLNVEPGCGHGELIHAEDDCDRTADPTPWGRAHAPGAEHKRQA